MSRYAEVANLITKARDYKREYKNYHGKPEQIKNRASRNAARRKLAKQGRVKPGDGKDVDHRDHEPKNNDDKNLRVRDMSHNRADNKHKSYVEAANLMAQVQRAGARHSSKDNSLIQQLHDLAIELGATCEAGEDEVSPVLRAAVEALVLKHPGHGNQKVHGNRFGAGQAKESFRRLKDDKGARERYKETARARGQGSGLSKFKPEEQGYVKAKQAQIKSLRSDKENTYKQQQATSIEDRLKSMLSGKEKFPSDIYGPAPKVRAAKPKAPKVKERPISDKVDMDIANAAVRAAGGDKQAAWSRYIQIHHQRTGQLAPDIDAKDFFRAVGK